MRTQRTFHRPTNSSPAFRLEREPAFAQIKNRDGLPCSHRDGKYRKSRAWSKNESVRVNDVPEDWTERAGPGCAPVATWKLQKRFFRRFEGHPPNYL